MVGVLGGGEERPAREERRPKKKKIPGGYGGYAANAEECFRTGKRRVFGARRKGLLGKSEGKQWKDFDRRVGAQHNQERGYD